MAEGSTVDRDHRRARHAAAPSSRRRHRRPHPSTSTTSTTTTTPTPSAETPARVLVVGDSDAGTFGPYLEELLDETGVAETTVDYKVSSGLSRPDFFDWPAHLRRQLPDVDPDIVVVTFGGNDAQGMALADGSFPAEWNDPVAARDDVVPGVPAACRRGDGPARRRWAHGGVGRHPQ